MATVAVLTNVGRAQITGVLASHGPGYMGFGKNTGATTAAVTDTALNTELTSSDTSPGTYARPATTLAQATTNVTNDTLSATATFTQPSNATASVTVAETGLFDAATSGNLWAHATFTGVVLSAGFALAPTMNTVFG